jgi:hypothetical protein
METESLTRPDAPPPPPRPPEPATGRALWPTFLRRTLAEEQIPAARPEPR